MSRKLEWPTFSNAYHDELLGLVQSCASSQANHSCLTWKVVEAVHARSSFIFMQLFATGRAARPSGLTLDDPSFPYVGAGDISLADRNHERPRSMTVLEIKEYIQLFATAASNAVNEAGFDSVEIQGADGYLADQFLQTTANNRPDDMEDMRMLDPLPTFRSLVSRLRDTYPDLSCLHVVEPRIAGAAERESKVDESNDDLRKIWGSRPYLAAGGFTREDAIQTAEEKGGLVVFGRHFISNPDLPTRLLKGLPLTPYDRVMFYIQDGVKGYTEHPFSQVDIKVAA
ncbi:hypothetical protein HETIRDRAFT_427372 [Heterobasidion irregulare TC 32-1]|uniref:NADH:flavin oxidoreductase/NADH oxidase N-terminal domain-containing protein n=1 Tax=Heterobasidion irregulare (strain TC 32-1) TaxID=747525 RepID=W4KB91_HETIT|nr:uncharacterized protein HETIRDRAFT_427372 [Heterobasidion irregulare TC 32-1]ETW82311.1 hypothetical protein HETIRDRAFT_427372 [Heterobasidion irregulare TC 32-1]